MAKKTRLPDIDPAGLQEEVPSLSSAPAAMPSPAAPAVPSPPAPPVEVAAVAPVPPPSPAPAPVPAPALLAPALPAPAGAWHENAVLRISAAACLAFVLGYLAGRPQETPAGPVASPPAAQPSPLTVVVPDPGVVQALAAERAARARLDAVLAEFNALLNAAAEGRDFSAGLERLRAAAGGDATTLAVLDGLRPFAAGVPPLAALAATFEQEAAQLLAQATPVAAQGIPGRTLAWARGLLEPDRLAARIAVIEAARADLARGLPEAAAGRLTGLDPQGAAALQDWAMAARARAGLDRAVRETALVAVAAAARMAR